MVDEIKKERMLRNLIKAAGDRWGGWDDGYKVLRELYLTDLHGACMPYESWGKGFEEISLD